MWRVTSSPISLGLIGAFAPQITKVSGTVQADVRVTGAARDPHLGGGIDIRNGAFTIADLTNGGYTGLDTRITLAPDRVRLEEFSLMDEHQHTLRVSGELAVHQRQIGGVQIAIKSDQFEIIDNALADIKLNSDLRIDRRNAGATRGGDARRAYRHGKHRQGAGARDEQRLRGGADEGRGGGAGRGTAARGANARVCRHAAPAGARGRPARRIAHRAESQGPATNQQPTQGRTPRPRRGRARTTRSRSTCGSRCRTTS